MKLIAVVVFLSVYSLSFSQIELGEVKIKDVPFKFFLEANGLAQMHEGQSFDPFYHGSGFIQNNLKIRIGENVDVNTRVTAEVWSFSSPYEFNYTDYFWAKPSLKASLNDLPKIDGKKIVDTLSITIGDLWRQKIGNGLLMEDFESQGVVTKVSFLKSFFYEFQSIGSGWTRYDDMRVYTLGFKEYAKLSFLHHFYDNDEFRKFTNNIWSLALNLKWNDFEFKSDIARNSRNDRYGFLGGVAFNKINACNTINVELQYRHYDPNFFFDSDIFFPPPYLNSITAMDKRINNFQFYQLSLENQNVLACYLNARQYVKEIFFANLYLERLFFTSDLYNDPNQLKFAYDLSAGCCFNTFAEFKLGATNKLFQLSYERSTMFTTYRQPWYYSRIEFHF